jgi:transposase
MREHCTHARFVWNLCLEQQSWWRPGRAYAPGRFERQRQLTEARAEFGWLRAGSSSVQQCALIDFDQAMQRLFAGVSGHPTWRKSGRREGFRVVGKKGTGYGCSWDVRRLSRKTGEVKIPKVGWVRFRWSRPVPEVKSFRVTLDRAGRWHVGFTAWPAPVVPGPGTGEVAGVDRGVAVSAALSTGELLQCPGLRDSETSRLRRLDRKAARQRVYGHGESASGRLKRTYLAAAKLRARQSDRRKDWAEKTSTDLARRFDVIRVEDLRISNMTRSGKGTLDRPGRHVRAKSTLNRRVLASGWGLLAERLQDKMQDRLQKVRYAYTSQRCSACGTVDAEARESQAVFACRSCGHAENADVNAARNIAAGYVVNARGGPQLGPAKREPQCAA